MRKEKKTANLKPIYFITLQVSLYALLIFLIISVNLNANYINKIDSFVFNLINFIRSPFINNFMLIITYLGDSTIYIITIILLITLFFKKRKIFYPLIFMTSLSGIINSILKELIQKARPVGQFVNNLFISYDFPTSYSFPSGHTQTSLVFYFLLTYILLNNFYKGKHRKLYLSIPIIISVLIMISRLILGVHFFSDILGGTIIAIILLTNYIYLNNKN